MPANYYSDGEDTGTTTATAAPEEGLQETGAPKKTATINSDICPGMEVGDEMVLTIEAVRDGEYSVTYSPEPDEEEEPPAETESAPAAPAEGSMSSLME